MWIFYELRYTVIIEIVWNFYLKSVPAKFQKYSKHISWVFSGTSLSKLFSNPRHPSGNISCNHRHHLLQPSWRRIFSTSNNQKTRVDSDINSDYKDSSFDKLYIRLRNWDTAGFVRAHQRKYWNALTVGRGHADDGCSGNHSAVPPSEMMGGFTDAYVRHSAQIMWAQSLDPHNERCRCHQQRKCYHETIWVSVFEIWVCWTTWHGIVYGVMGSVNYQSYIPW